MEVLCENDLQMDFLGVNAKTDRITSLQNGIHNQLHLLNQRTLSISVCFHSFLNNRICIVQLNHEIGNNFIANYSIL